MPLPVVAVIGIVGAGAAVAGSAAVGAVVAFFKKQQKNQLLTQQLGNDPPRPPRGMTRKQVVTEANKVGMDIRNYYNFAFSGSINSGKSSLINALRNLDNVRPDPGREHNFYDSAPTGYLQTTSTIRQYAFPEGDPYENIRLWDLPGYGNVENPSKTHFKDNCMYGYDGLILLVERDLLEWDYLFLESAKKYEIPVAIVVSKADEKVQSEIRNTFNNNNPPIGEWRQVFEDVKEECRARILRNLQQKKLPEVPIYVLSSRAYRDMNLYRQPESMSEVSDNEINEEREKQALLAGQVEDLLTYLFEATRRRRM